MKKLVYFLAFTLIIACQKNKKENSENIVAPKEMTYAADTIASMGNSAAEVAPSSMAKTQAPAATVAASTTKRSKTQADTKETETVANQTITPQNTFFIPQNTTSSRKIVRTAQVRTKVEQTEKATYQIESIARKWHGFVTANNLENRVKKQEEVPISADSILQVTHSEVVNTLSVRVPNQYLDTFLMEMSRLYVHLDYRRVNAEDLTAHFLTNQLKSELRNQSSQRIAAATDAQGKRLNDIVAAEESRVQLSDEAIMQKVQNVETDYDIAYSTVGIEIYGDMVVSKNIMPSMKTVNASFGLRCQQAFANGWAFLLDVFIGILNFWVFILMGLLAYALYRRIAGSVFSKLALAQKE